MDAKISSDFWEDLGELPPEEKLCALWLMTNNRRKLCGYVEVTERVFRFHTGLDFEALQRTLEALPSTFVGVGKGIWIRNFIRRQFGAKERLVKSNCAKALCNEINALGSEELRDHIALEYPEIRHLLYPSSSLHESKPLTSPLGGVRVEKRREENGRGAGETGVQGELLAETLADSAPKTSPLSPDSGKKNPAEKKAKKNAAATPLPEQLRRFGTIFGRPAGAQWSYAEMRALEDAQPMEEASLRLIEWRYRQPEEEGDPHRKKLLTLLENLPGELDAARAQFKRLGAASPATPTREEPKGWREILEKKYRRPEDIEWKSPASFYDLPASLQADILEELKQQKTCEK